MSATTYNQGDRILFGSTERYYGTVAYIGPLDGTSGIWLGIDWDDPSRGKHDGKGHFIAHAPTSGSFIRPTSPHIQQPISIIAAIKDRYITDLADEGQKESIMLGSSNGMIEVEAVNLNKIRKKFARLDMLREAGLDGEAIDSVGDELGVTCPRLERLDVSRTLINDWNIVVQIVNELPSLKFLALNYDVFKPLTKSIEPTSSLVTELLLNGTCLPWHQLSSIPSIFPALTTLELGLNKFSALTASSYVSTTPFAHLHTLNLDSNNLEDWLHIATHITSTQFPKLERLILINNRISHIPPPPLTPQDMEANTVTQATGILAQVTALSLSQNGLGTWKDIDMLAAWCPRLTSLSIVENPIVLSDTYARQMLISRIPGLTKLDNTEITPHERQDSELFYLSYITRTYNSSSSESLEKEHPRWKYLCSKHNHEWTPTQSKQSSVHNSSIGASNNVFGSSNLKKRLIDLSIVGLPQDLTQTNPTPTSLQKITTISVLPTMSLKALKLKLTKLLPSMVPDLNSNFQLSLWLDRTDDDGEWREINLDESGRAKDISWIGIEEGSVLGVATS